MPLMGNKLNALLPAAIVKHFVCVLEKAHITPEYLWPQPSLKTVTNVQK